MTDQMSAKRADVQEKRPSAFGSFPGPRRRRAPAKGGNAQADRQLIEDFLRQKGATQCPTRYADGAIKESGAYSF